MVSYTMDSIEYIALPKQRSFLYINTNTILDEDTHLAFIDVINRFQLPVLVSRIRREDRDCRNPF